MRNKGTTNPLGAMALATIGATSDKKEGLPTTEMRFDLRVLRTLKGRTDKTTRRTPWRRRPPRLLS
jgi:hypothetical protein